MATHVIAVRPDAHFWVINEILGVGYEIVEVIRSGGILGLRNGDALMRKVGARPYNEL